MLHLDYFDLKLNWTEFHLACLVLCSSLIRDDRDHWRSLYYLVSLQQPISYYLDMGVLGLNLPLNWSYFYYLMEFDDVHHLMIAVNDHLWFKKMVRKTIHCLLYQEQLRHWHVLKHDYYYFHSYLAFFSIIAVQNDYAMNLHHHFEGHLEQHSRPYHC